MLITDHVYHHMQVNSLVCTLMQLVYVSFYFAAATSCNSRLLSDRAQVPDSAFEHSSAVNAQHGAAASRNILGDADLQERAWCPDALIHTELREYMQVDLGQQRIIKLIITKGRVAQSKGRQVTPFFYIKYRREATGIWFEYRKDNGTQRMNGNRDAMTENFNTLEPPFVARFVRIYPFSWEPQKTCLKIELLGCDAQGVVEYQVPQGTVLSDALVPTYTYEPRQLDPRMRFQDSSYDLITHDSRLSGHSSLQYTTFEHPQMITPTVLRGGLGKLVDKDTELNKTVRPFFSYKYMGWKRPFVQRPPQTPWSFEDEHVRILFRFDAIYNFTGISLYLANDFKHDVSLPRNITVQCSLHFPASTDKKPDSSIPLRTLAPAPDRSDHNARWIFITTKNALQHQVIATERTSLKSKSSVLQDSPDTSTVSTIGIGRFVDIRLYFEYPWIVLGEVEFENVKQELSEVQIQTIHPTSAVVENSAVLKTNTDSVVPSTESPPSSDSTQSVSFSIGQSTVTLGTICGILAALIGIGMICLCFLWRQKRMRSRLEQHFHRGKRPINGSNHFDCLSELQTPNMFSPTNHHYNNQNQNPSLAINVMEAAVNSCEPGQTVPVATPLFGQNRNDLVLSGPNNPDFTTSLHPFAGVRDPGYQTDASKTPRIHGDLVTNRVTDFDTSLQAACFGIGDQFVASTTMAPQPMQFIPFISPQTARIDFRPHLMQTGTMKANGLLPDDPFLVMSMHDTAIYTSLPGSDCDSQPYARISNGDTDRRYSQTVDGQTKPFHMFLQKQQPHTTDQCAFRNLPQAQFLPMLSNLPPPPTMPLPVPPVPQHFSSSPSQSSTSHNSHTQDDQLINSGTPLVPSDSAVGETKDTIGRQRWSHVKHPTLGRANSKPYFLQNHSNQRLNRGQNIPQMQQQIQCQPLMDPTLHLRNLQGSDYSNTTIGSSTNAYGAYYGTPSIMAGIKHNVDALHNDIQIHR